MEGNHANMSWNNLPQGWDYTPDGPRLSREEIRKFFAKRSFCRPHDWEAIADPECLMFNERRAELSLWIRGYLTAKG